MDTLFDHNPSIDERFREFDRENPHVFRLFERFAREVREAGHTRYSADAILHRIRWHCNVEIRSHDFKINDHFSSRYARLLVETDQSFANFFEFRRLRSGDAA